MKMAKRNYNKRLFWLTVQKWWKWILLGGGIVLGYVFFMQKDPIILPEKPKYKPKKLPKKPKNVDWINKLEKDLQKIEKERAKVKTNKKRYLDLINRKYKNKRKDK